MTKENDKLNNLLITFIHRLRTSNCTQKTETEVMVCVETAKSKLLCSRCMLDTMRLVDLLLVLLFEGRKALPKAGINSLASRIPGLRRMDSAGERSHRQLIDCIRSKDTDALIDAVDNGSEY